MGSRLTVTQFIVEEFAPDLEPAELDPDVVVLGGGVGGTLGSVPPVIRKYAKSG